LSLKFSVSLSGSCKKTVYLFNTTYILEHLIFLSYVVCHHNVCLPSINIYFEERFIFLPSKFGVPVGLCVVGLFAASTTSKYISCRNKYNNTTQHNTTQHNTTQHNTTQHNTTQHNTTQHNTTQHNTTQHNTTQHNTTQHKAI
jgi:stringent starvation protein B